MGKLPPKPDICSTFDLVEIVFICVMFTFILIFLAQAGRILSSGFIHSSNRVSGGSGGCERAMEKKHSTCFCPPNSCSCAPKSCACPRSESPKSLPSKLGADGTDDDAYARNGGTSGVVCFPGCDYFATIYKKTGALFWVVLLLPIVLILLLLFWSFMRKCKNRRRRRRGRRGSATSCVCRSRYRMCGRNMPELMNATHEHYLIVLIGVAILYLLGEDDNALNNMDFR